MSILFFLISLLLGAILAIVTRKLKIAQQSHALSEERIRVLVQNYDKEYKIKDLDSEIIELQSLLDHRREEFNLFEQRSKLHQKDLLDTISYLNSNIQKLKAEQRFISEEIDKNRKTLYAIDRYEHEIRDEIYKEVVQKIKREVEIIIQKEQEKQKQLLNKIQELHNKLNQSNPHYEQQRIKLLQQLSQLEQDQQELYEINQNLQNSINSQNRSLMKFKVEYEALKTTDRPNLDITSLSKKYNRLMRAAYSLLNDGSKPKTFQPRVREHDPFSTDPSDIWRDIRENG